MRSPPVIDVIIPAYNEEGALPLVLAAIPGDRVRRMIVADNNSTDATAAVARQGGAVVVTATRQGYGSACLAGIAFAAADPPDIVVFVDADFSDDPAALPRLVEPIEAGRAELVIGSRTLRPQPKGAFTPQQYFGNKLACFLMRWLLGARFTDLGPFRAITWPALERLHMRDPDFGWTVEMQIKAAKHRVAFEEIAVDYRHRAAGHSKIAGTLSGTLRAGKKILQLIFVHGVLARRRAD